jgi:hypothetical protein
LTDARAWTEAVTTALLSGDEKQWE